MDIYLTDLETEYALQFPMLPQKINVRSGAIFQSYTVLSIGDIKLPTGSELAGFSWDGMLPGAVRKNDPYITVWRSPKEYLSLWSTYQESKKKLRLLVTETPINCDVYLEKYNVNYSGGYGDYNYSISFIQAKDLKIYASGVGGASTSTANTASNKPEGQERPKPPPPSTVTVKKGDSLWKLAEKHMGSGAKYSQLYEANKAVIGPNPNLIYPGQVLAIPS